MKIIPIKRALLSVSDKSHVVEFAQKLIKHGVEIISTGGTSELLRKADIPHLQVDHVTGLPEMLDGRVKTLHPIIHGGILGRRDKHAAEASEHQISWIDLVVVNFYPFAKIANDTSLPWSEVIELIDIGGPTMVRAAAKNFAWVGVVVDPTDYAEIVNQLETNLGLDESIREQLAQKAFALTASYDAMINQYFLTKLNPTTHTPTTLSLQYNKVSELRYGENPHQSASAYQLKTEKKGILSASQHQGKPLSFNNILDAEAALTCVAEFDSPTCVIVKHANPCGVATAQTIDGAYERAYAADPKSAFGGIIALNRPCTLKIAEAITRIFMEVVIAPDYTQEALDIFATKPNLRILQLPIEDTNPLEMKHITGGLLLQEKDLQRLTAEDLQIVTQTKPTPADIETMLFAWRVLKHIKSNGILLAKNNITLGIGAGQVSRIDAVDIAIRKAGEHITDAVLASDAFFPFRDSIDLIAKAGLHAIIQPGGSVRDEEVIAACDENKIAMVFTGKRCFKH